MEGGGLVRSFCRGPPGSGVLFYARDDFFDAGLDPREFVVFLLEVEALFIDVVAEGGEGDIEESVLEVLEHFPLSDQLVELDEFFVVAAGHGLSVSVRAWR